MPEPDAGEDPGPEDAERSFVGEVFGLGREEFGEPTAFGDVTVDDALDVNANEIAVTAEYDGKGDAAVVDELGVVDRLTAVTNGDPDVKIEGPTEGGGANWTRCRPMTPVMPICGEVVICCWIVLGGSVVVNVVV